MREPADLLGGQVGTERKTGVGVKTFDTWCLPRHAEQVDEDPRIGFLRADVARFCDGLDGLAPAQRLGLVVALRTSLVAVVDAAMVSAMREAVSEGWGLRRVAQHAGMSHEQVRIRLAESARQEDSES